MQLTFQKRLIRFFFMPISLLATIMMLNFSSNFNDIAQLCNRRNICYSYCTSDNFPDLSCSDVKMNIEYNGNAFENFFVFPNPYIESVDEFKIKYQLDDYDFCQSTIAMNPSYPFEEIMNKRQWNVHACFDSCRPEVQDDPGFSVDERPVCGDQV
jgi:hypothetical protein